MADINDLIDKILSDEKLKNSKAFGGKIYKDEPILRPASSLQTGRAKQVKMQSSDPLPPVIDEMKRLSYRPDVAWKTNEWLFAAQGKVAADYEDSFEGREETSRDMPVYKDLSTAQLRTYFTWRTEVRHGGTPMTCLAYMKLYAYELINLIGVSDEREAFDKLTDFAAAYSEKCPEIRDELSGWIFDHVVYNRLDPSLLDSHPDVQLDKALITLKHYEEHTDSELFEAVCTASSYDPRNSAYAEKSDNILEKGLAAVYRAYAEQYGKSHIKTLFDKLIGGEAITRYTMFRGAVLYPRHGIESFDYELNELHSFRLTGGMWYCKRYLSGCHSSKHLGEFVRMTENELRRRNGMSRLLKADEPPKQLKTLMKKVLDSLEESAVKPQVQDIEIDISKLDGIRKASDITREKLIVDEDELAEIAAAEQPEPVTVPEPQTDSETPLGTAETAFMKALLYGGDADSAARSAGSMVSLLADSVNEKLFDIFGDTVIGFDGETPLLIEDYIDELKGMILP